MPHRFFIPTEWITPPTVSLSGDTARQIKTVLRMQPGDEIVVLDNSGSEWQVVLTIVEKKIVQGQILARQPALGEPEVTVTLYQGMLKAQKFEWVLQKGTELGVSCFVPTICQRSIVKQADALAKKQGRWQQIIREAAEQSGRGKLPQLQTVLSLPTAITEATQSSSLSLMPWEETTDTLLKTVLAKTEANNIALFIGPEGGFTRNEAILAQQTGVQLITLGPRTLRAETAGLAVSAAIFYQLDQW